MRGATTSTMSGANKCRANIRPGRIYSSLRPCIGLVTLVCAIGCNTVDLAKDLEPEDASGLVQRLRAAGVQAELRKQASNRTTVSVSEVDVAQAMAHLDCTWVAESTSCATTSTSLLPTPRQDYARLRGERECQLSKDLTRLQGVRHARVRLSPAPPCAMDASPSTTRAAVWVEASDGFDETSVRNFVHGAVPDLDRKAINLVVTPTTRVQAKPQSALAHLGPLRLAPESLPLAKFALATVLTTNLLLTAALVLVWRTSKKGRP